MKKPLSVLLCITLILTLLTPAAADELQPGTFDYPTVVVPGYSSSDLYIDGEKIWGLDKDSIIHTVLTEIAQFGRGLGELALQRSEYLADLLMTNYPDRIREALYPAQEQPADPAE